MSTVKLILGFALMLHVTGACDGPNEQQQLAASRQQQSDEYFANAYGFTPETWSAFAYRPSNFYYAPEYSGGYEGRTSLNSHQPISENSPFNKYFGNSEVEQSQAENRFLLAGLGANLINTGIFNNRFTPSNTWRPFQNLANRLPAAITLNANTGDPLTTFDACKSPTGEDGICVPGSVCSLFRGRPSGSCIFGKVCCINTITTCGGTVTLNNTFWQSPTTAVSAPSTCALTVRMDTKLVEQIKRPICQIRLDFVSFTTAQPTLGTCSDTFVVGGSASSTPIICGDNTGQHMYLDVPNSAMTPTDVQLMFNFAAGITASRSWNIKIAMLPCGASYLAPKDCLQYFSSPTGKVKSFNWQDVTSTATRQLNNQNYNICFRTERVAGSRATQLCASVCTVTNGGDAFSITTPAAVVVAATTFATVVTNTAAASSQSNVGTTVSSTGNPVFIVATCLYDFLQIAGGQDPTTGTTADRFCGNQLNPATGADLLNPGQTASAQVCTSIRPFRMTFTTDGTEAAIAAVAPPTVPAVAGADTANTGFCLDYQVK